MHFTPLELTRLIVVLTVEGVVCGMAWWRGLFHRLPLFTAYLSAVIVCDVLRFSTIFTFGPRSKTEFILYWTTQWILVLLRAAVVYELCRQMLGAYPGVWRLCIMILCLAAMVLVCVTLLDTTRQGPYIARLFLTIERGFELEVLGVLFVVSLFYRYYRIPVDRLIPLVILGLSVYSAMALLNDTFASHWFQRLLLVWREVRGDSFLFAEIIWLTAIAIWKPSEEQQRLPVLLNSEVYSELTPVVSYRLRELNARLEEILR
jgi:hypothetical protein